MHRSLPLPITRDPAAFGIAWISSFQWLPMTRGASSLRWLGWSPRLPAPQTRSQGPHRPTPQPVDQEVGDILAQVRLPARRLHVTDSSLSRLKTGSWLRHRSGSVLVKEANKGVVRLPCLLAMIFNQALASPSHPPQPCQPAMLQVEDHSGLKP